MSVDQIVVAAALVAGALPAAAFGIMCLRPSMRQRIWAFVLDRDERARVHAAAIVVVFLLALAALAMSMDARSQTWSCSAGQSSAPMRTTAPQGC